MNAVKVSLSQGTVRGCRERLPNGRHYLRFSGIPYANAERFRDPQKLLKFAKSEIDCTKEGDECYQKSQFEAQLVGSENCLYLNVYVPSTDKKKLATMVWIHG
jgi:carboxylesterase type B